MAKPFEFSEIQAEPHPRHAARPAHAARPRGARQGDARSSQATVKELNRILAKRDVLMGVIREELVAIRDAHKAPRRTQIVTDDAGTIDVVALVEDEPLRRHRDRARLRAGRARARRASRWSRTRASATRSRR